MGDPWAVFCEQLDLALEQLNLLKEKKQLTPLEEEEKKDLEKLLRKHNWIPK